MVAEALGGMPIPCLPIAFCLHLQNHGMVHEQSGRLSSGT